MGELVSGIHHGVWTIKYPGYVGELDSGVHCGVWMIKYPGYVGDPVRLSEHKHCDNVVNRKNARSRIVASLWGSVGMGRKEDEYWASLGCWISACYGPFSLGTPF